MALIKPLNDYIPEFGDNTYFAENATIIGNVVCGDDCSFWFNSVVRGDVHEIRMGNKVNIQDGAVIHCSYKKAGTYIGNSVSIGHNACVHGCKIDDFVLVGMGAIVMDNVHVPSNTIIAAGAVVTENQNLESNCIYAGVPAKKVKELDPEYVHQAMKKVANNYVEYSSWYQE